jgi:glycosyltransferase involved in cell wall biosynthesis
MHVLLIHQIFMSPNDSGGTRHYELAQQVIGSGDSFTIVASDLNYLTGQKVLDSDKFITEQYFDELKVLRTYTYPSLHRSFTWRIISFLSFTVSSFIAAMKPADVDIVMGTSPPIFQAASAWLVAAIRRKPFLLEIRDLWPDFAIDIGVLKNPILIYLSRWLESFLYKKADHLLVNSPAYKEYLISKGIKAEKVTLIANGVDIEQFDPINTGLALRQELNLDDKFIVTYAGALGLANDLDTLLQAASLLNKNKNIHVLIVGDGKERQRLEALAKDLDLNNLTFTGAKPKSEMPNYIAASDSCIAILKDIPMFKTTYPNKVFDYMAASRPIILAIDGVIRDVVESAEGGLFVQPGDPKALADAILKLSADPEVSKRMGESARAYVIENFNRKQQGLKFVELLHQLTK